MNQFVHATVTVGVAAPPLASVAVRPVLRFAPVFSPLPVQSISQPVRSLSNQLQRMRRIECEPLAAQRAVINAIHETSDLSRIGSIEGSALDLSDVETRKCCSVAECVTMFA